MFPGSEDIYQSIGQNLLNLLPHDFKKAFIRVEMIDDVWSIGIFFLKPSGKFGYMNNNLETIGKNFREFRQKFKDANQEPWSMATFQLSADGKMELDIGYDDVSDFGQNTQRRANWIKKYLGDNPQIDWS